MSDRDQLFTIGELARRTGLSVRTIRFWSDEDVVPPTRRAGSGYRLYDVEAVARLDLVKTLRELGMDLPTVRAVLREQVTLADVAATHVTALDTEIKTLKLHRAVLASVAHRESTSEEMRIMHELAKLSAAQRQDLINEFVNETFSGIAPDAPGAHIADGMRQLPSELPDDPTTEQVDAWIELAELIRDEDFRKRCRQMAVIGSQTGEDEQPFDDTLLRSKVTAGVAATLKPGSPEAEQLLAEVGFGDLTAEQRAARAEQIEIFIDRRVYQYWRLLGILNGWPAFDTENHNIDGMEWLIKALRA
ncbi:DNA-binding transcriptional MerR regulator [Stackebrandtia endophytica]|uniref:DNA-binding transcriptional MerR regulator n=1 Tax=Stackebrandtia endophytica TaxID=1496996 RepID=A0A543ASP5_9ACTN|nr:MerR family transcriptional regulator [Stackebrandtia endophytica]TQL75597.1 DNA-binding transcriptional MerR regulator [Stackebrandtia endophytica]